MRVSLSAMYSEQAKSCIMIGCTQNPNFESKPTNLRQGPPMLFPINRLIKTTFNPLNKRTFGCFQESFLSRIRTVSKDFVLKPITMLHIANLFLSALPIKSPAKLMNNLLLFCDLVNKRHPDYDNININFYLIICIYSFLRGETKSGYSKTSQ